MSINNWSSVHVSEQFKHSLHNQGNCLCYFNEFPPELNNPTLFSFSFKNILYIFCVVNIRVLWGNEV